MSAKEGDTLMNTRLPVPKALRHRRRLAILVAALVVPSALVTLGASPASAAAASQLTRYPYLTDVVSAGSSDNATVNFATDQTITAAFATIGPAGGSCSGTNRTGSKTGITVNGVAENQWKVKFTGLSAGASYCYRLFSGSPTSPGPDLLGSDPSPVFPTPPAPGSGTTFKFAVFGDWGFTNADGTNPDQANLDQQIAASGAQFAFGTGDTAYPSGSQTNYGDLLQTGANISDVFAPNFFKNIGKGIPMYNALGNHGVSATYLNIWPQPTAPSLSGGRYQMETYCCVNGTNSASYPSAWYAFSVGAARFYVLDATWPNGNLGNGTPVQQRLGRPLDHKLTRVPVAGQRPGRASGRPEVRRDALPDVLRQPHRDNGYLPALGRDQPDGHAGRRGHAAEPERRAVRVQRPRPHL